MKICRCRTAPVGERRAVTEVGVIEELVLSKRSEQATCTVLLLFVVGYEKRDHIAQNVIFFYFSTCHHSKAIIAPGFPLGL